MDWLPKGWRRSKRRSPAAGTAAAGCSDCTDHDRRAHPCRAGFDKAQIWADRRGATIARQKAFDLNGACAFRPIGSRFAHGVLADVALGRIDRRYLAADEIERTLAEIFLLPVQPSRRPAIERAATAEIAG